MEETGARGGEETKVPSLICYAMDVPKVKVSDYGRATALYGAERFN